MNRESYYDAISEVEDVLDKYNINEAIAKEVQKIRRDLDDYACRILVVGGFNAGKSAFLNALLDRDILEEAQIPETSIATELCYDKNEFIEAISEDGKRQRFQFAEGRKLMPKDWRYLVYHIDCPYLQNHSDLILVDMPGLDSNYEWHNKAISQYINRGTAYILMVSCEDGTLRASVQSFLQEIRHYHQGLYCFISKTNLRPTEEVDSVQEAVRSSIERICEENTPVSRISVRDDPDFKKKAEIALNYFNSEKLFNDKFAPVLNGLIDTAVIALDNSAKAMTLNDEKLNERITSCQGNRARLKKQLEDEKEKLVRKYKTVVMPAVQNSIMDSLTSHSQRFAAALTVSPEAFSSAVNSVLRTALYDANTKIIRGSFEDLVKDLDLSFLDEDYGELQKAIQGGLENLLSQIQQMESQGKNLENGKRIYEVVTGILAITTDFISPVLELAIVFLPSIFNLISGAKKQEQEAELESKIRTAIIPQIMDRLIPDLELAMHETLDMMLTELENRLNQLIVAEETALEQAKNEKLQHEQKFEEAKQAIYEDADKLQNLRVVLEGT